MPTKISWWEPAWSHRVSFRAETAESGTLRLRFWLRVTGVSVLIMAALIAACLWAYPGMYIPYWRLVGGTVTLLLYFIAWYFVLYFVRPNIVVRHKSIAIAHGNSCFAIRRKDLISAIIDTSDPRGPLLILHYSGSLNRERTRSIGIAEHVDLAVLADLLGDKLLDE